MTSITQIWQLKNSNSDNLISDKTENNNLVKTTWHPDNQWDVFGAVFCNVFLNNQTNEKIYYLNKLSNVHITAQIYIITNY